MNPAQAKRKTTFALGIDLNKWSPIAFVMLIFLAFLAFWPNYLSNPSELGSPYTHLHAITATLWFILLIVQPLLIHKRRKSLHRTIGKSSFVIGPVVLIGMLLGAHGLMGRFPAEQWALSKYILYLQLSLGLGFGVFWLLAMMYRKDQAAHARFMVATGLTFVDPVLARILPSIPDVNTQVITLGIVNFLLLALIWKERDAKKGRWVFPLVLGIFVLIELPMFFGMTQTGMWESFAEWFRSLPMT